MKLKLLFILPLILLFVFSGFTQDTINDESRLVQVKTWQEADSIRNNYLGKQNFPEAKKYAELAIELVEKEVGDQDTLYADMTLNLMVVYYYTGKYTEAIKCVEVEKAIREKVQGRMHPLYGECLSNLGLLYKVTGRLDEALPIIEEGVSLGRLTLGEDNPELGIRLMGLANMYTSLDKYDKALPILMESKSILAKSMGEVSDLHLSAISNLAQLYSIINDFDNALKYSLLAMEMLDKLDGKANKNYSILLNNLAELYEKMGSPDKALPLYEESVQLIKDKFGDKHVMYGRLLSNLGNFNQKHGNNELAEVQLKEGLTVLDSTLGKQHILYTISLNNLGYNYLQLNQYQNGLNLLLDALKLIESSPEEHLSSVCLIYNNIGNGYESLNKTDSAIYYFNKGLSISNSVKNLRNSSNLLNYNIAKSYDINNEFKKSYTSYNKAMDGYVQQMIKNFSFMSEEDKEGYFSLLDLQFSTFYNYAQKHAQEESKVAEDAYNLVIRNKGVLLKSSFQMRESILNSNDSILISTYEEWMKSRKKITKIYASTELVGDSLINRLEDEALRLERDLVRNSQVFAELNEVKLVDYKSVKDELNSSEVAIEFVNYNVGDEKYYSAFIIKNSFENPIMIKLFSESELVNVIGEFGGNNLNYIQKIYGQKNEVNKLLYDLIWSPIAPYIGKAKKVFISPSGSLHKISFAAIKTAEKKYLSDEYHIEMITSTANLVKRKSTKLDLSENTEESSISLYGGVKYNTDKSEQQIYSYLKGTKSEVENIGTILKSKNIKYSYYSGENASETEFKNAENFDLIHFATHGFFFPDPSAVTEKVETNIDEETNLVFRGGSDEVSQNESFVKNTDPLMRSGLVLAGANDVWNKNRIDKVDDGMLTALEVSNMNLSTTKLVVLSACETGLGDINGTEGVYGLQRSLKMAGVNFIIMSLWQVPDKETEEFMTLFYGYLVKNKDIKKSFDKTQKVMRKKYDAYYWAAFVLME
jgi:CHAT domain-containing protein